MARSMKIETSSFGLIVIDGKTYCSDLTIYPDGRVDDSWWRKSGHRLAIEDIGGLLDSSPEVIIVGTGVSGLLKPMPGLAHMLAEKGIELVPLPNPEAIARFNELSGVKRVGACFHLTC